MMYTICSILLVIDGSEAALEKGTNWEDLKAYNEPLYKQAALPFSGSGANLPGELPEGGGDGLPPFPENL